MAGVRVRSVAAGYIHTLALSWDGRVYSWGDNHSGQLGHGDLVTRPSPALVEALDGVSGVSAKSHHSLALTQSGVVFGWGEALLHASHDSALPQAVEGFGEVRVLGVSSAWSGAFAIGEAGELFSWGSGGGGHLGHGDRQHQPWSKRVEALRGVRMSAVSVGLRHSVAMAEDGQVYTWGENTDQVLLGDSHVKGAATAKADRGAPRRARGQHRCLLWSQLRSG
jgi:alpha-tubulin suppressor-like RCC1 family protein